MEDKYINPLSEYIFEEDCREGDRIALSVEDEKLVFKKQ